MTRCYGPTETLREMFTGKEKLFSACGHAVEIDGVMYCEKNGVFRDYGMRCAGSIKKEMEEGERWLN